MTLSNQLLKLLPFQKIQWDMPMTLSAPTPDELIRVYIKIRNTIRDKEAAHKADMAGIKEDFEKVANSILDHCKKNKEKSVVTEFGTASRVVRTRYNCSDWAAMYRFIHENDAAHVLEKRINIKAMEEFLTEHPESLPVGLHSDKAYTVQVRKPTTKVK